jgi:hypothetical protein
LQRSQACTADDEGVIDGEEQPSRRTGIAARQCGELLAKALEAEVDTDIGLVLEEELANMLDVRRELGITDHRHCELPRPHKD